MSLNRASAWRVKWPIESAERVSDDVGPDESDDEVQDDAAAAEKKQKLEYPAEDTSGEDELRKAVDEQFKQAETAL